MSYDPSSLGVNLPPGSLKFLGVKKVEEIKTNIIDYGEEHLEEREINSIDELSNYNSNKNSTLVSIIGLHNTDYISKVCNKFNIHPLTTEDILNTNHRPKIEIFEDYILVIIKIITFNSKTLKARTEQLSLILSNSNVVLFQESNYEILEPLKRRIRAGKGKIRTAGNDYLMYAILDTVIDQYFIALEQISSKIEEFEEELISDEHEQHTLQEIYGLKRELLLFKKSTAPIREMISKIKKADSHYIDEKIQIYYSDLYDNIIQIIDSIESNRDLLSGILDLYMSTMSNKMNEVIKVLTIISTIFIPLTFIAGVYGMNFEYMPELMWKNGYYITLGLMLVMVIGMLIFFRRKKWI